MPPSLRSSAPNSPAGKASSSFPDPPPLTPRKVPHCTKCGRPRAGHPRSGCPYQDSPTQATTDNNITDALGSMTLTTPTRSGTDEATRPRQRSSVPATESLLSLSSNSSEIVARLLQPGMFDGDTSEDESPRRTRNKVVRWQDAVQNTPLNATQDRMRLNSRSPMPGSLFTPSPEGSFEEPDLKLSSAGGEPTKATLTSITTDTLPIHQPPSSSARPRRSSLASRVQPLARSMSMEQRDTFVSSLTRSADATVFLVPKADIHALQSSAVSERGFHARIAMSEDSHDTQGLLILGRDEKAVQRLLTKIVEGEGKSAGKNREEGSSKGNGRLRAAAGGAVVGAVGAWAGLAFS